MWIIFFLIPVQIPFYLKNLGVEKNVLIGMAIAVSTLFSAISSISYSRIKGLFSFHTIFIVGYSLMAIAYLLVAMAHSYLLVLFAMMFAGLGMGMMIPNTNIWVMKIAPPEIRGKEIGKLTTFWFFGQFLSPIVLFPLISALSLSGTFLVASGVLLLLSLAWLFFLISNNRKLQKIQEASHSN
jgi:MFS family permease